MGQHQTGRGPKGPYASSERHRADSPGSPPTHTHIQKRDVASCHVCVMVSGFGYRRAG